MKRIISFILSLGLVTGICSPCLPAAAEGLDYETYLNEYIRYLEETLDSDYIYTDSIRAAVGSSELKIDSEEISIPEPVENSSSEAFIPIRPVAEAMGKEVLYTEEDNTVKILDSDTSVAVFSVDESAVNLPNDTKFSTEVDPYLKDGTTYLQLEDASDILGCSIEYDNEEKTISIERPFQSKSIIVTDSTIQAPFPDNAKVFDTIHGYSILSFETERETKIAYQELSEIGFLVEPAIMHSSTAQTSASVTGAAALSESIGSSSSPVKVAVIDSGIERTHSFLKNSLVDIKSFTDENCTDVLNHGTHVAGIVHTFAPNASIIPIKVFDDSTEKARTDIICEAIYYAVNKGADIINMSLSGEGYSTAMETAIKDAYNNGVVSVAAAGNDYINLNNIPHSPASISECVTVSAVERNGFTTDFSNFGDCIDIAAYGVDIYSSVPGNTYALNTGTSMAAPEVAGAIALVMSMGYSAKEAENMVLSCTVEPTLSMPMFFGRGILGNLYSLSDDSKKCGENIAYSFDSGSGTLRFTGVGDMYEYTSTTEMPWSDLRDSIRSVVFSDGITNICSKAFWYCENLTQVTLPDTLESIGENAFYSCTGLNNIELPDSLTSIGDSAFEGCASLQNITIPHGVTSIGKYTFYKCSSLASVTIPDSVISIGDNAFRYCTSLAGITIPESVTSIGIYTFSGCTNLTSVKIPGSLTHLEDFIFSECTRLTSVTLSDGVQSIYGYAFSGCTSLINITIPKSVTSIGNYAFRNCNNLTAVYYNGVNYNWNKIGISSTGNDALKNATVYYLGIPVNGITLNTNSIRLEAKDIYTLIASVTPDNAAYPAVTWVSSDETVAVVENGTVTAKSAGTAVITATTVDGGYSASCNVTVAGIVESGSCGSRVTWALDIDGNLTISGSGKMSSYSSGSAPWRSKGSNIKSIVIEDGVTSIGDYAFRDCTAFESITIPSSMTSIGDYAFSNCSSLKNITICDGLTTIESYAFAYCDGLETITIPASVTSIESYAFGYCNTLKDVYYGGTKSFWEKGVNTSGNSALTNATIHFLGISVDGITLNTNNMRLEVDDTYNLIASVTPEDATNKTVTWKSSDTNVAVVENGTVTAKAAGIVVITATTVDESLSASCTITVPGIMGSGSCGIGVTWTLDTEGNLVISGNGSISNYSLGAPWHSQCRFIKSIVIENGVTSIGKEAFRDCTAFKSITIPASVTYIGAYAFRDCTSLENVTICDGLTTIESYAFAYCAGLKTITIPASVTSIESYAFGYCNTLKDVYYGGTKSFWEKGVNTSGNSALTNATIHFLGISVDGITLNTDSITLEVNNTYNLIAEVTPEDATDKTVTWKSSNEKVAVVENGTVTAKAAGKAVITATTVDGGFSASCTVTVPGIVASGTCGSNVRWTRSHDNVLTISGNGAMTDYATINKVPWYSSRDLLTSVVIEAGVTSIGDYAFYDCENITSITIPLSVVSINESAFSDCRSLKDVYYAGSKYDWEKITIATYGNGYLKSATIHYSNVVVEEITFNTDSIHLNPTEMYNLVAVISPENATDKTLTWSSSDTTVAVVSNGIVTAKAPGNAVITATSADGLCSASCNVTVTGVIANGICGENVTWALNSDGLLTISGNGAMSDYSFDNTPWNDQTSLIKSVIIEDGVTSIGNSSFSNCSNLVSITIPDSVSSIGTEAFLECASLESLDIPDSVTFIGEDAFYLCENLTSIVLPDSVTYLGEYAFARCTSLTSITIPDGLTTIEQNTFYYCSNITDITIPVSVIYIKDSAFKGCNNLADTYYNGTKEEWEQITVASNNPYLIYSTKHYLGVSVRIPLEGITLNTSIVRLNAGDTYNLIASVTPDNATSKAVEWTSSDTTVAAITNGVVTAKSPGSATITATTVDGGFSASCKVVVEGIVASGTCGENVNWILDSDGLLTISGVGDMTKYSTGSVPWYSFSDSIESVIIEAGVTSISAAAFQTCVNLKNITIPDGITSIGNLAFGSCESLTSITIPDSVTSIGSLAFSNCTGLTDVYYTGTQYSWGKITISSGNDALINATIHYLGIPVEGITLNASNVNLEIGDTHTLTASVTPDNAKNKTVTWKSSNEDIAVIENGIVTAKADGTAVITATTVDGGFSATCTVTVGGILESGTCGEGVTYILNIDGLLTISGSGDIKSYAFPDKKTIKDIVIEDGVTSIGYAAFRNCTSLESINIPDSVALIEDRAFYYCTSLASVAIPEGVTSIGSSAFAFCSGLKSITIPGSMTSFGNSAFASCSGLKSVTIPGSVSSLGYSTFQNCTSLESVIISEGVTSIGGYVFASCSGLKSITLPNSLTYIRSGAFSSCNSLTDIYYDGTQYTWKKITIDYGNEPLSNATIHYLGVPVDGIIDGGSCGTGVTWTLNLDGLITISGTGAMTNYSAGSAPWSSQSDSIKSVVIENSVTSIGNYAFNGCANLASVTIHESVTAIRTNAFSNCTSLTNVYYTGTQYTWNKIIISSGNDALKNAEIECSGIPVTGMTLNTDSIRLEKNSTYNLIALITPEEATNKSITWRSSDSDVAAVTNGTVTAKAAGIAVITAKTVDGGFSATCTVTVPGIMGSGSCGTGVTWTLDTDGNLVITGNGAMSDYSAGSAPWRSNGSLIKSIVIENGVTSIGGYAFRDCTAFESITIPGSITYIGEYAFRDCTSLKNVTISNGLKSIGSYVFAYCDELKTVTIPGSVTSINECAFLYCDSLTDVYYGGTAAAWGKAVSEYGNEAILNATVHFSGVPVNGITINTNNIRLEVNSTYNLFASVTPDNASNKSVKWSSSSTKIAVVTEDGTVTAKAAGSAVITAKTVDGGYTASCTVIVPGIVESGTFGETASWTLDADGKLIISGEGNITTDIFRIKTSIKSVELENGITSIGSFIFYSCSKIKSVTIPDSVTAIENSAFVGCDKLTDVYYAGTQKEWEKITIASGNNAIQNATIHCLKSVPVIASFNAVKSGNSALIDILAEDIPENCAIYVAAYENNRLTQISPVTLNADGNAQMYFTLAGENKFKLFVFDSLQSITPLCRAAECTLNVPAVTRFEASDSHLGTLVEISTENIPENCAIYVAAYENNRLTQISPVSLDADGNAQMYFTLAGENKFKLFVFDSLQSITPLCRTAECSI